jgi:cytochrome P450
MSSLFLALVLSPQIQKRAQEELDLVVGRDRLPTFDDRPRLPYIEAICRELLRWQMVTPMGSVIPYFLLKSWCGSITFRSSPRVD